MVSIPRDTVTFVFTDIEGSTTLAQALGERWLPVLDRHNAIVREAVDRLGGYEVKTEGDAFFVTFTDPVAAVEACVAVQLALAAEPWDHGQPVRVRIGVHRGPAEVMETERDYAGVEVHRAARIGAAANGGQIIVSAAVRDAVDGALDPDVGFADLGLHGLKDFAEPEPLFQVTHPELPELFAPLRSLTAIETALPSMPTAIIGRDDEADAAVRTLRDDARLVTLTGPGGIGKSRLAIEVGHRARPWFRDGVWFVPLVNATTAEELVAGINRVLGLVPQAEEPLDALVAHLAERRALVILDNLEQLGDDVAELARLLTDCPELRILATSRTRLRLRGERRVEVVPLTVPGAADELESTSAGELLLARLDQLGIDVADADRTWASTICRLVDGIPLGIELAAARADELSLATIAAGLDDALDVLSDGDLDLLPHQRTMRSAVRWSVDLLGDAERRALTATGTFAGDIDADALAVVVPVDPDEAGAVLRSLADASLAKERSAHDAEGRPRFWLLEPIRRYAVEMLGADPERPALRARWWDAMTERGCRYEDDLTGSGQVHALAALDDDVANLEATVRDADPDRAARLAAALVRYWTYRGRWREGRALLETTLARGGGSDLDRAKLGMGAGHLAVQVKDDDAATDLLDAALAAAASCGASTVEAPICNVLASLSLRRGDVDTARRWWQRATQAATRSEDPRTIALVANSVAGGLIDLGQHAAALSDLQTCLATQEQIGDVAGSVITRNLMATCLDGLGRLDESRDVLLAAAAAADRAGFTAGEARALANLADTALKLHDRRGEDWAARAIELAVASGDRAAEVDARLFAYFWGLRLGAADLPARAEALRATASSLGLSQLVELLDAGELTID